MLKHGPDPKDPRDRVVLVLAMQLGLRAGEIAHLTRDWIRFQERRLIVPLEAECHLARDGSACSDCRRLRAGTWNAKSEAGSRAIPYRDITGAADVLHAWFTAHDELGLTRKGVWQRVRRMATRAGITRRFTAHAGRATAAQQFADLGLGEHDLCDVMGWADPRTGRPYIKRSGLNVEGAIARGKREGRAWL